MALNLEKKLEMLKELDSTTDWQELIRKGGRASKSQAVQQTPTRKLTKAEKKNKRREKQLEVVRETMEKKNVQTVVFNNPDSSSAKSNESVAHTKKKGEQRTTSEESDQKGTELDLNKARHEIIKFGMSSLKSKDLEDAEASLAIRLGATPNKRPSVNYKEFQVQRKKEREEELEQEASLIKPNLTKIMKSKPGKKGKMTRKPKKGQGRSNNTRNASKHSKPKRR